MLSNMGEYSAFSANEDVRMIWPAARFALALQECSSHVPTNISNLLRAVSVAINLP
jgi:hypothetical protein